MTEVREAPRLVERGIYLVTTTKHESLVGEYAGTEGEVCVFVTGPFSPIRIPQRDIASAVRLG